MSALRELAGADVNQLIGELVSMGLVTEEELVGRGVMRTFRHGTAPPVLKGTAERPIAVNIGRVGERELTITTSRERMNLERAFESFFSIRDWQRVVVSVYGALWARIQDQRQIGRQRGPGERSPAPLPDWYELNHLVYEHGAELGLDPDRPVYQYLPSRLEPYLNVAEALHLRQPK